MTKKSHDSKKATNGIGHKPVKGIIVLFTLKSLKKLRCGSITPAMEKILIAIEKGESRIII